MYYLRKPALSALSAFFRDSLFSPTKRDASPSIGQRTINDYIWDKHPPMVWQPRNKDILWYMPFLRIVKKQS